MPFGQAERIFPGAAVLPLGITRCPGKACGFAEEPGSHVIRIPIASRRVPEIPTGFFFDLPINSYLVG